MSYGILSGKEIVAAIENGDIEIDPFDSTLINPGSYDLRLGSQISVYSDVTTGSFEGKIVDGDRLRPISISLDPISVGRPLRRPDINIKAPFQPKNPVNKPNLGKGYIDASKQNPVSHFTMRKDKPFMLMPGIGYLMHTEERVRTGKYVPVLDGKSSIGRLFCAAHITAGYGDVGFDGQYTLEVIVTHPLIVYSGMRFCQIRFHTIVGEVDSYQNTGNYKGDLAKGPVPSRSWKQFKDQ